MQRDWLQYDLGQAMMAMMIAAADLGIGTGHAAVGDQAVAAPAARRARGPLPRRAVLARLPRRPAAEAAPAPRPAALRGRRAPRALVAPTRPVALRHDAPVPTADRAWLTDVQVCPSILAADFGAFRGQRARTARRRRANVPRGRHGRPLRPGDHVRARASWRRSRTRCTTRGGALAVHMMVERPERFVDDYAKAGADAYTVHVEATPHLHYWLQRIREAGMAPGVTLNPGRRSGCSRWRRASADNLLCMSVNPGWGGQSFIPASLERLRRCGRWRGPAPGSRSTAASAPDDDRRLLRAPARTGSRPAPRSSPRRIPPPRTTTSCERVRAAGPPAWA